MFRVFDGRTADDAWQKIASCIRAREVAALQASRNGTTLEILHAAIAVSDPRQRWVVSRNPPLNIAFALAEVVWIMAGRNDAAFLNYFNRELPKYCGAGSIYHGAYGYRLRKQLKVDQLDRAYQALSQNPETRQVVLQIWDSTTDLPALDGQPLAEDIPCNIVSLLKVRNGALEWTQIMRSNDVYRGLPYNFVQFTTIQEIMAGWLNLKMGSYNHLSDSLHIYHTDLPHIDVPSLGKVSQNGDSLALPKMEFDAVFAELEQRANLVVDTNVSAGILAAEVDRCKLPTAFSNILCVLCAEGSRRRKDYHVAKEIMRKCSNEAFQQLYAQWLSRFE